MYTGSDKPKANMHTLSDKGLEEDKQRVSEKAGRKETGNSYKVGSSVSRCSKHGVTDRYTVKAGNSDNSMLALIQRLPTLTRIYQHRLG